MKILFSAFSMRMSKIFKSYTRKIAALLVVLVFAITANAQKFIEGTYVELEPGGLADPISFTFKSGKIECNIWHGSLIIIGTYRENYPGVLRVTFKDVVKGDLDGLYNYATNFNVEWSENDEGRRYITFSKVGGLRPFFTWIGKFYLTGPNAYNKTKKAAYEKKLRQQEELKELERQKMRAREEAEKDRVIEAYLTASDYYEERKYEEALSTIKEVVDSKFVGENETVLAAECACKLYMKRRDGKYFNDVTTFCERAERKYKKRINPYCQFLAYLAGSSNGKFLEFTNDYYEIAKERVNTIKNSKVQTQKNKNELVEIAWNISCYMNHTSDKEAQALKAINTAIKLFPDDPDLLYKKCEIALRYYDIVEVITTLALLREKYSTLLEEQSSSNSKISKGLIGMAMDITQRKSHIKTSKDEALSPINTAIEFFPNDHTLLYSKCAILLEYKDTSAARKTWKLFKKKFKKEFEEGNYSRSAVGRKL